jgi:lipoprotein-anchoring transpeptidase ErfK/SrfK
MSGPGYYQPNVPHTMFFYRGYAIHGSYWRKTFGLNVSHGCVNLNLTDAATIYAWTPIGTKVVIHD